LNATDGTKEEYTFTIKDVEYDVEETRNDGCTWEDKTVTITFVDGTKICHTHYETDRELNNDEWDRFSEEARIVMEKCEIPINDSTLEEFLDYIDEVINYYMD
jgi:major membrane immunogen (membrane-anchored lipoprotein)